MSANANTGVYQRRCKLCARDDAITVRVVASEADWVVVAISCGYCGVAGESLVGERGRRARVLLENRPHAKATRKLEATPA